MTRLSKFINEAIGLQDRQARQIIMSEINKIVEFFDKKNWDMETALLGALLNIIFKKHGISFTLAHPDQEDYQRPDFDYIVAGQTLVDGKILVYVSNNAGPALANAMKNKMNKKAAFEKSQFFKELVYNFSHELIHREQWKRAGEKWIEASKKGKELSIPKYLSTKQEITAWAQDAALAFIRGDDNPNEIDVYKEFFGIKHPVFKRFMKRFYNFVEQEKERRKLDAL